MFSDFDGTPAPIVEAPAAARPLPGVVEALGDLARRYGRVGVISGRPAAFLQTHLGGQGLFLSGLYGLELVEEDGDVRVVDEAEGWRTVVEEVACAAEAGLPPGVSVERKGLSVTVHHRLDPSQEPASKAWADEQARATGLVVHPARMSFELRPPVLDQEGLVAALQARLGASE